MTDHDAWSGEGLPGPRPRIWQTRIFWFALIGVAVLALLRHGALTVAEAYRTSEAVLQLEQELAGVQREHDELQHRLGLLATPEGKRLEAAYQLRLVRPGERLVTFRQDDETREAMSALDPDESRAPQRPQILKRLVRSPGRERSGDE